MAITAQTLISKLTELSVAGDAPFSLMLGDEQPLACQHLVRRVPGRRIVCQGLWQGKRVYAKIFIGTHATRHAQRDRDGSQMLADRGIPTPKMLYAAALPEAAGQVLLYEEIAPCSNAEESLVSLSGDDTARLKLMLDLSRLVALHHQAGLLQTDMYLKNFLVQGGRLYTLDGDGIRRLQGWGMRRKCLSNLARMISKQDAGDDAWIPQLYDAYCEQRGWSQSAIQLTKLVQEVADIRRSVAREYAEHKVLRECGDVQVTRGRRFFLAVARAWKVRLGPRMEAPDALLTEPPNRILKSGNTCTVSLVEVSGQKLVVKRYNIKNFWHGLNRAWRPSRAASAWSNAFRLNIYGIATAAPIALLEQRWGILRRKAYFVAEHVEAPDLKAWMAAAAPGNQQQMTMKIAKLLHKMQRLQLAHGDLKANNIKILEDAPVLIDLDSMRDYRFRWMFSKRHARDLRRLLRNWQDEPAMLQMMEQSLMEVYGNDPVLEAAGINGKDKLR